MRIHWKLLAGFSLFGALISLISGIAGGNPFGVVVLRLVLSAIVFAGLGVGVQMILRRYLPDLLQGSPPPARPQGGSVDIIIDEELPASTPGEPDEDLALGETAAPSEGRQSTEEDVLFQEAETAEDGAEAGEFSSEPFAGAVDGGDSAPQSEYEPDAAFEPGIEYPPQEGSPPGPASRVAAVGPLEEGDLEVLPEFDALDALDGAGDAASESSAAGPPGEQEAPARQTPATPREMRQAQIEETVKDQDPETLARAVRTFLKKDQ